MLTPALIEIMSCTFIILFGFFTSVLAWALIRINRHRTPPNNVKKPNPIFMDEMVAYREHQIAEYKKVNKHMPEPHNIFDDPEFTGNAPSFQQSNSTNEPPYTPTEGF